MEPDAAKTGVQTDTCDMQLMNQLHTRRRCRILQAIHQFINV